MALNDMALRQLAPVARPKKLHDGNGLFLLHNPNGSKLWRLAYRLKGKPKTLALGRYPEVTLLQARNAAAVARQSVVVGSDPVEERRRAAGQTVLGITFAKVVAEYEKKREQEKKGASALRKDRQMFGHALPEIGERPIASIRAPEILTLIRRIEARGNYDTAHRLRSTISRIFRYGIASGYCDNDPAAPLSDALVEMKVEHHPKLTSPADIALLKARIDSYSGSHVTKGALLLTLYTFVRPGNVRFAEWSEFDLAAAQWRIPALKMKMAKELIVPLAPQVVRLVEWIKEIARPSRFLFPSIMSVEKPISDSTCNTALRIMGFDTATQINCHGFRGTASTWLNESGRFNPDAIERQLAHVPGNIRSIYNAAEYLPERVRIMRYWADFLDSEAALVRMLG